MKLQEKLISSFDKFEQSLNGSETESLRKLRTEGIEVFKAKGFPTTKDEEWKYTPLNKSIKRDYDFATGSASDIKSEDVDRFLCTGIDSYKVVFINGFFNASLYSSAWKCRIESSKLTVGCGIVLEI